MYVHQIVSCIICYVDTNECLESPCKQSQKCINTFGSYKCDCYSGYEFDSHSQECKGKYHTIYFVSCYLPCSSVIVLQVYTIATLMLVYFLYTHKVNS